MRLTDVERAALGRIRNRQRAWRVLRWVFLVTSILAVGLGIYGRTELDEATLLLTQNPQVEVSPAFYHAMVRGEVASRLLVLGGFALLVYTIVRWRGGAVDVLVLALLREETTGSDVSEGAT
jgi:hypothetical protein